MKAHYQAIYLSPHLDDAVLSCGGQIAAKCRRGEAVLIATLAAGDPVFPLSALARELHATWKTGDRFDQRRHEDIEACRRVGADYWHGDAPDAIYRYDSSALNPLYQSLADLFKHVHPADGASARWHELIGMLPTTDAVYVPLGVGSHVDHQLVRQAAEAVHGRKVIYYEDFPYASKWFSVYRLTRPRRDWSSKVVGLTAEDIQARCNASCLYRSQVEMLAGGDIHLSKKIRSYVRRVGGERIWQRI